MIASLLSLLLQAAPLPPANPLPPPGSEEGAVVAVVTRMLDGLTARDPAAMRAVVVPEGHATAVVETAQGTKVHRQTLGEFVNVAAGPERFVERLDRPAVEIDGDIAMVWAPYTFLIDNRVSHCGYNHIDLVREDGRWRIGNITWTQRTTGCPAR